MKITKKQLKTLVKEAVGEPSQHDLDLNEAYKLDEAKGHIDEAYRIVEEVMKYYLRKGARSSEFPFNDLLSVYQKLKTSYSDLNFIVADLIKNEYPGKD